MIKVLPKLLSSNRWLEKKQNTILSAALVITIANILSSISGLLRERLLIARFFDTQLSQEAYEAFQVAFQIPDLLFQLIVLGAVSAAFIPTFTKLRKKSEKEAFGMTSVVMNVLLLAFIALAVVAFIFSHPLTVWRTGEAFTPQQIQFAAQLTRIMLVAQVFFAVSNFLTGILQSYQRFILPALAPVLYNAGILFGVYFFAPQFGIYSAGIGVVIGALIHMAVQLPLAFRLGFRFNFSLNLNLPGVKDLFRIMPPRVIAIGVSEVQTLALGFFATSLGNLSFVIIKLALRLMTIPIRLFGVPISQASLPFLSKESADDDFFHFQSLVIQSLHQIAFLAFPASVVLLILRIPLVRLVFGTKNFPWETTVTTGWVVAFISISVAAQAMTHLFMRAFYALKDTTTPLRIASMTLVLYLGLTSFFVFKTEFGLFGIAATTTVAAWAELLMLVFYLHKKIGGFTDKKFWFPQLKIIAASFLMAIFLYLPFKIFDELVFDTKRTVNLIGLTVTTGTIGMMVYLYFAALFDIRELRLFTKLFNNFGPWRKIVSQTQESIVEPRVEGDQS